MPMSAETGESGRGHVVTYADFETEFRATHPVLWWGSLAAPVLLSLVALLTMYAISGADYAGRVVTMAAAALCFFGRFVILGGHDPEVAQYTGKMSSGELFVMVCYLDVMVAFVMAIHVATLFRLPLIGHRLRDLTTDVRFVLNSQKWMRRAAFAGTLSFVAFPLQATGSVGGTLFGRMLGMRRAPTFVAIVIGSLVGNAIMYFCSDWINAHVDRNSMLVKYGGALVIVVTILALNFWYRHQRNRYVLSRASSGSAARRGA
jgi:uncharacterized membrane protein